MKNVQSRRQVSPKDYKESNNEQLLWSMGYYQEIICH